MTGLERRYRRLLRALPAGYRERWEDDMTDTFLLGAERDVPEDPDEAENVTRYGRPGRDETLSVLALALRLRLGGVGAPPRLRVWGTAVRRLVLVVLLVKAVGAVLGVAWLGVILAGVLPVPNGMPLDRGLVVPSAAGLLWAAAYLALVGGRRWLAAVFAVLGLLSALSSGVVTGSGPVTGSGVVLILWGALPILGLAAFHRDAPPVRRRPWLLALPAGVVVLAATELIGAGTGLMVDGDGALAELAVLATVVHLCRRTGSAEDRAGWSLALLGCGVLALAARVSTLVVLVTDVSGGVPGTMVALGVAQACALVVALLALTVTALRGLRDLPRTGAVGSAAA